MLKLSALSLAFALSATSALAASPAPNGTDAYIKRPTSAMTQENRAASWHNGSTSASDPRVTPSPTQRAKAKSSWTGRHAGTHDDTPAAKKLSKGGHNTVEYKVF